MPLLTLLASLLGLLPLRIAIASPVYLLLVEWAELRTTARHLFLETEQFVERVVALYQTYKIQ